MKRVAVLPWFSIGSLALLVLVYILGTWVAEDYPITTVIAYAPPIIWLPLPLVLVFCSLAKRNRGWLRLNLTVLAVFGWMLLGVQLPLRADRSGEDGTFTLMTFNVMGGRGGMDEVIRTIREADPDYVCLQEAEDVARQMSERLGYHMVAEKSLAVLSKEPSIRYERHSRFPLYPGALEAEFSNGLTIVSAHLAYHTFDTFTTKQVPVHMQTIAKIHQIEVDMLANRYANQPGVVIAGDFNCPPRGDVYREMRRNFSDSFASAGWLTGYTWPSQFPVLRIDYAFTTNVKAQSARTISSTASNHRPILFTFKR